MSMQDPIADMLTRIRNGQSSGAKTVKMPSSKLKVAIANVLKDEGFIQNVETEEQDNKITLTITLKYVDGKAVIESIKRISKPSLRIYKNCDDIRKVKGGLGISIVSTPKGVITDHQARKAGVGGEVLCEVA